MNAFEKIRFAAVEGKLPSGGCPEDMTLTVPSFPRRTRPPDILGCASQKRTLARGPIDSRTFLVPTIALTPRFTKVAGRLSRLIANRGAVDVLSQKKYFSPQISLLQKEEFPPMNK